MTPYSPAGRGESLSFMSPSLIWATTVFLDPRTELFTYGMPIKIAVPGVISVISQILPVVVSKTYRPEIAYLPGISARATNGNTNNDRRSIWSVFIHAFYNKFVLLTRPNLGEISHVYA